MGEITATKSAEPRLHLWTKDEYYKMAGVGLFDEKHVELIEGRVFEMSPMGSHHAVGMGIASKTLDKVSGPGFHVRSQLPLNLSETSEPEPDIAVIRGEWHEYFEAHPRTAVLIVEVSESSLAYDRTDKASLYARYGIEDYWILNLVDRQLEVHRDPAPDPEQLHGYRYRTCQTYKRGDAVSPLEAPQASIAVAGLLP